MEQTTLKNKLIKFLQEEKKEIKDFVIQLETEKNIEHKIDGHELDDDIPPTSQYFPTSSQTEISDEDIEKAVNEYANVYQCPSEVKMCKHDIISAWKLAIEWYREQLKKQTQIGQG